LRLGYQEQSRSDAPSLATPDYRLYRGAENLTEKWHERGWRLNAVFDQMDHAYFPTSGWRVDGQYFVGHSKPRGGTDTPFGFIKTFEMQAQGVRSWGRHTLEVYGRVGLSEGAQPSVPRFGLGGFQQLSGYSPYQISGPQVGLLRLDYRVRLADMPLTRGLYLGASGEVGNAWERARDLMHGGKKTGMSLYLGADTALGPVYLAVVNSPQVGSTVMLFVGRP